MISDFFQSYIKRQKNGIVIYPNDLFDQRVQEEMIRADEYKSYFVYVELDFAAVAETLPAGEEEKFWEAVIKSFATKGRGSDVIGLLGNNTGLGLIMLESKMEGWTRLSGRIREFGKNTVADMDAPLKTVKAFVYPAYIENEETATDFAVEANSK